MRLHLCRYEQLPHEQSYALAPQEDSDSNAHALLQAYMSCMLTHAGALAPCMLAFPVFDMKRIRERFGVRQRQCLLLEKYSNRYSKIAWELNVT